MHVTGVKRSCLYVFTFLLPLQWCTHTPSFYFSLLPDENPCGVNTNPRNIAWLNYTLQAHWPKFQDPLWKTSSKVFLCKYPLAMLLLEIKLPKFMQATPD